MGNIFDPIFCLALTLFRWLEDLFIPPCCQHCGARRFARLPLCRHCASDLGEARRQSLPCGSPEEAGELRVHALFALTPPLQTLIHGFKYRRFRRQARFLCSRLRRRPALMAGLKSLDVIVPVPMHSARRRDRGYNQAVLLAREIGKQCGQAVIEDALRRIRPTPSQTRLTEDLRRRNLSGAFLCHAAAIRGKRILLVDDVCTTGSTLSHCREELLRAGAAHVEAWVVAFVDRHDGGGGG